MMTGDIARQKIAIFASFSGYGGVEKMLVNLCRGIATQGYALDLVLVRSESKHLEGFPENVRIVKLGTQHTLGSIFALARYLKTEQPVALLAAKDRAGRVAVMARKLTGVKTRIVFRMGTTVSAALEGKGPLRRWLWYLPMRLLYPMADRIVAVSRGVADDLIRITRLPEERFTVIHNPVITEHLPLLAEEPVDHPWFIDREVPVIVGVGRLTRQKDFPTLLQAFALVCRKQPSRLVIFGEGRGRAELVEMALQLGVQERVDFPGFVPNPYKYLQRASLFVLSSAWEGSPNVLTEALSLGIPVVATDCPSGPREILQNGLVAPLVPVGNPEKLATAMLAQLTAPQDKGILQSAVKTYNVKESSQRYLDTLLALD